MAKGIGGTREQQKLRVCHGGQSVPAHLALVILRAVGWGDDADPVQGRAGLAVVWCSGDSAEGVSSGSLFALSDQLTCSPLSSLLFCRRQQEAGQGRRQKIGHV